MVDQDEDGRSEGLSRKKQKTRDSWWHIGILRGRGKTTKQSTRARSRSGSLGGVTPMRWAQITWVEYYFLLKTTTLSAVSL